MYLAVDVGGTKTLMAAFTNEGKLNKSVKFSTPNDYYSFLSSFTQHLGELEQSDFLAAGLAIPGRIDASRSIGLRFGNLAWKNVPIRHDVSRLLQCPVALDNDAKAGALAEALKFQSEFQRILYVAIGTGIGLAYVNDGELDYNFGDGGGARFYLHHNKKLQAWERFASGRAIVERFGKKASEITDESTWKTIASDLSVGILPLLGVLDVDAVVIGGGVGRHFKHYGKFLRDELRKTEKTRQLPVLLQANYGEESVIYGCYELARREHAKATK